MEKIQRKSTYPADNLHHVRAKKMWKTFHNFMQACYGTDQQ